MYLEFVVMAGFVALMYFTHFLVAIPIFLVVSIVVISKGKLLTALAIAAGVEAFMYVVFELIL